MAKFSKQLAVRDFETIFSKMKQGLASCCYSVIPKL